jgi:hypothetical protein
LEFDMLSLRPFSSTLALLSLSALVGCNAAPVSTDEAEVAAISGQDTVEASEEALNAVHKFGTRGDGASVLAFQRQGGADSGYAIPAPYSQCVPGARAFKYLASDDWRGFSGAHRGAAAGDVGRPGEGFPRLRAVLANRGLTLADVVIEFDPVRLLEARFPLEAVNASHDRLETRHYAGANWRIRVRDPQSGDAKVVALNGATNELTLEVRYNDPARCDDDRVSGRVSTRTMNLYRSQSQTALLVGTAILLDLNGRSLRFSFDSMQPAVRDLEFRVDDAIGARFQTGLGRIDAL